MDYEQGSFLWCESSRYCKYVLENPQAGTFFLLNANEHIRGRSAASSIPVLPDQSDSALCPQRQRSIQHWFESFRITFKFSSLVHRSTPPKMASTTSPSRLFHLPSELWDRVFDLGLHARDLLNYSLVFFFYHKVFIYHELQTIVCYSFIGFKVLP